VGIATESTPSGRIWDQYITVADRDIYERAGFGVQGGGGNSPALLIIDVTVEFVGDTPEPIEQSIERFPNSCGEVGWRAMERIASLQQVCREERLPVLYTTGLDDRNEVSRGSWGRKKDLTIEGKVDDYIAANVIPEMISPLPEETVIQTTKPSAFFGTPLLSYLIHLGVDTLVITGVTTSGCVRASVVDAFSYNFGVLVAEDAVFDRSKISHAMNCFDMNAKYADVVPTEAILEYLGALHDTGR
jgi:maleamate amidohydrolase